MRLVWAVRRNAYFARSTSCGSPSGPDSWLVSPGRGRDGTPPGHRCSRRPACGRRGAGWAIGPLISVAPAPRRRNHALACRRTTDRQPGPRAGRQDMLPRTTISAVRKGAATNVALIAVPGAQAAMERTRRSRPGSTCFSSVTASRSTTGRLKRRARDRDTGHGTRMRDGFINRSRSGLRQPGSPRRRGRGRRLGDSIQS
jgi:hypothetical protein